MPVLVPGESGTMVGSVGSVDVRTAEGGTKEDGMSKMARPAAICACVIVSVAVE